MWPPPFSQPPFAEAVGQDQIAVKDPNQYFRAGVGIVITTKDGLVLAFERSEGSNRWSYLREESRSVRRRWKRRTES